MDAARFPSTDPAVGLRPKSVALAARACEGYIGAWPAKRLIGRYRERIPCGPDPERHLAAIQAYADAGYDEVHIL